MDRPRSILLVALAQLLGGTLFLFACGALLLGEIQVAGQTRALLIQRLLSGVDLAFLVVPICFAVLSLITSIGLLALRRWARRTTIFLATAPVLGAGLLLLLNPASIFPRPMPNENYAILTVGSGFGFHIYLLLFLALIPISLWWLFAMTRPAVVPHFR